MVTTARSSSRCATPSSAVGSNRWQQQGIVFHWTNGWSGGSLHTQAPESHPRYAVNGGMNALAKHLASELAQSGATFVTGSRLTTLGASDAGWLAANDQGDTYASRIVVLTAPVPQSLALLEAGAVVLAGDQRTELEKITYAPSLTALFRIVGAVKVPETGALQRPLNDIAWIADNRRKGISPEATIVTMQGSPAWSQAHFHEPEATVLSLFQAELANWLGRNAIIREAQLKRWRYAQPTTLYHAPFLRAALLPSLYLGGDAFGGPRIEGAALSGLAMGEDIAKHL